VGYFPNQIGNQDHSRKTYQSKLIHSLMYQPLYWVGNIGEVNFNHKSMISNSELLQAKAIILIYLNMSPRYRSEISTVKIETKISFKFLCELNKTWFWKLNTYWIGFG